MGNIPSVDHTIDPLRPFKPSVTGPFRETVRVNGKERNFICYIPEDVRASTSGVLVLPDSGITAEEMYANSNWTSLADTDERKEKFVVFFLEADGGQWQLDDPSNDLKYVHEVFLASRARDKYYVHEAKYYLVGYGEGGAAAQMAAMDDPAVYAGVVSINSPDLSEAFVQANGESACTSLDGYEDPDGTYGILKKDLTVPAWIISSAPAEETANTVTAKYWRQCAKTSETPRQLRPDVWEYCRAAEAPWTVNQEKEAFRVWIGQIQDADAGYGNRLNRRIWADFLRNVRRWMAEPGGDLRMTKDPVIDLGMEYHYEETGGWMREYYVYVPSSLRNGIEKEVPLVFAIHGYGCSGEIYAGNSEWNKVAEENGFLVVFPSAVHGYLRADSLNSPAVSAGDTELPAWNLLGQTDPAPDELIFFDSVIEKLCARYPIDRKRIYATGHSLGSLMTQYLGMARPNVFAAIAPCSGVLFMDAAETFLSRPAVKERPDLRLPVWMFGGEKEEWLLEAVPSLDNSTGQSIHTWWDLNRMTGEKPEDFEAARGPENGRWKDYLYWENHIPMIRYTWVEAMPHATMTEMSYRIWNEFFSRIRRNSDGEIEYIVNR